MLCLVCGCSSGAFEDSFEVPETRFGEFECRRPYETCRGQYLSQQTANKQNAYNRNWDKVNENNMVPVEEEAER